MRSIHRRAYLPLLALSAAGAMLLAPAMTFGQGLLVNVNERDAVRLPRPIIIQPIPRPRPQPQPAPQATYKINEIAVHARISDQVAKVQVAQTFENTGSRQMEVCFVFPLPYDGAVDRLTLQVDGKEYEAKLYDKDEARRMYQAIVSKNQDPALLEWMGQGLFKTSVFPVPAGAKRKVSLRYSQLLRKNQGLTEFLFPLSTAKYTSKAVERVHFDVSISSTEKIKNVYSPTHTVEVKRPDDNRATVSLTKENEVPTSDFRLFYDVGKESVGASVVSYRPDKDEDGYFMLLATPDVHPATSERPAKTVMFVVDRSGSMSGEKIEQAKGALKFVLNNLREGDTFNIIAYDSEVEAFRPELERFNDETRQAALGFVEELFAGGSTNIDGALKTALDQLTDSQRPTYVIFLTDGLPTSGETNEAKIVVNAKETNDVHARLFAFGVGYDVNSRLLDKLSRVNFGQSEYVRPNEDIEAHVSRLYNRIGAPVMTDVAIKIDVEGVKPEEGSAVSRVYPKEVYDLFAGEQLVMVGRYRKSGDAKAVITGSVSGSERKLEFPAELVEKSNDQTNAFVEKLWAMRRVGEIIDEMDLKGKNEELIKELVTLATKHGILTPYTSFLADENSDPRDLAMNRRHAADRLNLLAQTEGKSGFDQRRLKGSLQRAAQAPGQPAADADALADELFSAPAAGAAGGAATGRGQGLGAPAAARPQLAGPAGEKARKEAVEALVRSRVQNVGTKTFYFRDGRWIDESVTAEEEKNAVQLKRYSQDYFDLAKKHGPEAAKYLAIEEPVLVKIGKTVYEF